jgi:hypothetical protein
MALSGFHGDTEQTARVRRVCIWPFPPPPTPRRKVFIEQTFRHGVCNAVVRVQIARQLIYKPKYFIMLHAAYHYQDYERNA